MTTGINATTGKAFGPDIENKLTDFSASFMQNAFTRLLTNRGERPLRPLFGVSRPLLFFPIDPSVLDIIGEALQGLLGLEDWRVNIQPTGYRLTLNRVLGADVPAGLPSGGLVNPQIPTGVYQNWPRPAQDQPFVITASAVLTSIAQRLNLPQPLNPAGYVNWQSAHLDHIYAVLEWDLFDRPSLRFMEESAGVNTAARRVYRDLKHYYLERGRKPFLDRLSQDLGFTYAIGTWGTDSTGRRNHLTVLVTPSAFVNAGNDYNVGVRKWIEWGFPRWEGRVTIRNLVGIATNTPRLHSAPTFALTGIYNFRPV